MDQGKPESVAQVTPYEGLEDYIFISYSHRDTATVLPLLHRMKEEGYRFWYDEGIDPGSEWPESIAAHLGQCRVCLAFMSSTSLASQNCRREINFALSKNKEFLSVILEPVEMSPGMEMQISTYQSILKYKYRQEEQFLNRLLNLELLKSCREPRPAPAEPAPQPAPAEPAPTTPASAAYTPAAPAAPAPPMGQAWPASQNVRPTEPKPAPAGRKKWLPFAIAGGAVLLVVIVAVFALSGGFKPKLTINGKVYRDDAVTQRITGAALSVKQLKTLASFQECRYLYLTDCTLESGALEQLAGMEKLYHLEVVSCQGVGDLSFLDELPRLMHLVISDCGLTKVPELSDPARITELSLAGNPLDGLTGLSAWTGLASLDVSGCGLTSLTGLEGLQSIKWLYAADNQIVDLTPLSTLIYLSTLDLKNNQIESLVPLFYCQLLSVVSLRNNPDCLCVDDVLPLSAATLTRLDISGIHNVASLDFLSECSILTELYADDCIYLMTCEGLSGCPALTRLSLARCQIYDISGLAGLTALRYLNLADNLLDELPNLGRLGADAISPVYVFSNNDLTDLSNLPRLNYFGLMVDGNPLTDLSALGAMKGTYLVLDCTELTPLEPLEETGFTSIYATYVFIGKQAELEGNSHFRKAVSREEAFELAAGSNFTPDF